MPSMSVVTPILPPFALSSVVTPPSGTRPSGENIEERVLARDTPPCNTHTSTKTRDYIKNELQLTHSAEVMATLLATADKNTHIVPVNEKLIDKKDVVVVGYSHPGVHRFVFTYELGGVTGRFAIVTEKGNEYRVEGIASSNTDETPYTIVEINHGGFSQSKESVYSIIAEFNKSVPGVSFDAYNQKLFEYKVATIHFVPHNVVVKCTMTEGMDIDMFVPRMNDETKVAVARKASFFAPSPHNTREMVLSQAKLGDNFAQKKVFFGEPLRFESGALSFANGVEFVRVFDCGRFESSGTYTIVLGIMERGLTSTRMDSFTKTWAGVMYDVMVVPEAVKRSINVSWKRDAPLYIGMESGSALDGDDIITHVIYPKNAQIPKILRYSVRNDSVKHTIVTEKLRDAGVGDDSTEGVRQKMVFELSETKMTLFHNDVDSYALQNMVKKSNAGTIKFLMLNDTRPTLSGNVDEKTAEETYDCLSGPAEPRSHVSVVPRPKESTTSETLPVASGMKPGELLPSSSATPLRLSTEKPPKGESDVSLQEETKKTEIVNDIASTITVFIPRGSCAKIVYDWSEIKKIVAMDAMAVGEYRSMTNKTPWMPPVIHWVDIVDFDDDDTIIENGQETESINPVQERILEITQGRNSMIQSLLVAPYIRTAPRGKMDVCVASTGMIMKKTTGDCLVVISAGDENETPMIEEEEEATEEARSKATREMKNSLVSGSSKIKRVYAFKVTVINERRCVRCGVLFDGDTRIPGECRWHTTPEMGAFARERAINYTAPFDVPGDVVLVDPVGIDPGIQCGWAFHRCCGRPASFPVRENGCWVGVHSETTTNPDAVTRIDASIANGPSLWENAEIIRRECGVQNRLWYTIDNLEHATKEMIDEMHTWIIVENAILGYAISNDPDDIASGTAFERVGPPAFLLHTTVERVESVKNIIQTSRKDSAQSIQFLRNYLDKIVSGFMLTGLGTAEETAYRLALDMKKYQKIASAMAVDDNTVEVVAKNILRLTNISEKLSRWASRTTASMVIARGKRRSDVHGSHVESKKELVGGHGLDITETSLVQQIRLVEKGLRGIMVDGGMKHTPSNVFALLQQAEAANMALDKLAIIRSHEYSLRTKTIERLLGSSVVSESSADAVIGPSSVKLDDIVRRTTISALAMKKTIQNIEAYERQKQSIRDELTQTKTRLAEEISMRKSVETQLEVSKTTLVDTKNRLNSAVDEKAKLEEKYREIEIELTKQTQLTEKMKKEILERKNLLDASEERVRTLNSSIITKTNDLQELNNTLRRIQSEHARILNERVTLSVATTQTLEDTSHLKRSIENLKENIQQLNEELAQKTARQRHIEKQNSDVLNQLERATEEKVSLQRELNDAKNVMEEFTNKIRRENEIHQRNQMKRESEIDDVREKLGATLSTVSILRENVKTEETQKTEYETKIQELKAENEGNSNRIKSLVSDLDRQQLDKSVTEKQIIRERESFEVLKQELEESIETLSNRTQRHAALEEQITSLNNELARSEERHHVTQQYIEQLKVEIGSREQRIRELESVSVVRTEEVSRIQVLLKTEMETLAALRSKTITNEEIITALENENAALRNRLSDVEAVGRTVSEQFEAAKKQNELALAAYNEKQLTINTLEGNVNNIATENARLSRIIAENETRIQANLQEVAFYTNHIREQDVNISSLTIEVEAKTKEVENWQSQVTQLTKEIERINNEFQLSVKEWETQKEVAQKKFSETYDAHQKAEEKVKILTKEKEILQQENQTLSAENEGLHTQLATMKKTIETQTAEINKKERIIEANTKLIAQLEATIKQNTADIKDKQEEIEKKQQTISSMEKQLETERAKTTQLENEKTKLEEKDIASQKRILDMTEMITTLKMELASKENDIKDQSEKLTKTRKELSEKTVQLAKQVTRHANVVIKNTELNKKIESITVKETEASAELEKTTQELTKLNEDLKITKLANLRLTRDKERMMKLIARYDQFVETGGGAQIGLSKKTETITQIVDGVNATAASAASARSVADDAAATVTGIKKRIRVETQNTDDAQTTKRVVQSFSDTFEQSKRVAIGLGAVPDESRQEPSEATSADPVDMIEKIINRFENEASTSGNQVAQLRAELTDAEEKHKVAMKNAEMAATLALQKEKEAMQELQTAFNEIYEGIEKAVEIMEADIKEFDLASDAQRRTASQLLNDLATETTAIQQTNKDLVEELVKAKSVAAANDIEKESFDEACMNARETAMNFWTDKRRRVQVKMDSDDIDAIEKVAKEMEMSLESDDVVMHTFEEVLKEKDAVTIASLSNEMSTRVERVNKFIMRSVDSLMKTLGVARHHLDRIRTQKKPQPQPPPKTSKGKKRELSTTTESVARVKKSQKIGRMKTPIKEIEIPPNPVATDEPQPPSTSSMPSEGVITAVAATISNNMQTDIIPVDETLPLGHKATNIYSAENVLTTFTRRVRGFTPQTTVNYSTADINCMQHSISIIDACEAIAIRTAELWSEVEKFELMSHSWANATSSQHSGCRTTHPTISIIQSAINTLVTKMISDFDKPMSVELMRKWSELVSEHYPNVDGIVEYIKVLVRKRCNAKFESVQPQLIACIRNIRQTEKNLRAITQQNYDSIQSLGFLLEEMKTFVRNIESTKKTADSTANTIQLLSKIDTYGVMAARFTSHMQQKSLVLLAAAVVLESIANTINTGNTKFTTDSPEKMSIESALEMASDLQSLYTRAAASAVVNE